MAVIPALDRLKSQLLTSGLQERNNALYQVINQLIDNVRQNANETAAQISGIIASGGSSGGGGGTPGSSSIISGIPVGLYEGDEDAYVAPEPFIDTQITQLGSFDVSTTGTINDLDFGNARYIRMTNATLSTINGLKAGYDGQRVTIVSIGAGVVSFSPGNIGSAAANRLINNVGIVNTDLAAGVGYATYQYDLITARWRLVQHEQGAPISYSVTWSGTTTNPSLGNGTLSATYYLRGRNFRTVINLTAGSTTTFGTGFWVFSVAANPAGLKTVEPGMVLDNSAGTQFAITAAFTSSGGGGLFAVVDSTSINVDANNPMVWATNDFLRISGEYEIS